MEVVSKQTRHVFCNDWEGFICYLKSVEWDKFFMALPSSNKQETQETIERLVRDLGIQAMHTEAEYGRQDMADTPYMFLEGYGHFYRVDDPWNPAEKPMWLYSVSSGSQVYYIVIVEDMDDVEVDPF
ncbi:hypothetical protein [Vibrio phage VCPH]|nr:hypothetical protein [Vibrio phage VCPH]